MKYKVGDKVRVRSDLIKYENYNGASVTTEMYAFKGKVVTINLVNDKFYIISECPVFLWTDEMFEPAEEEMTAEEAIVIMSEICGNHLCTNCPVSQSEDFDSFSSCIRLGSENPEKIVSFLKQYKKDHEKKEIEVVQKIYCLVMDEERKVVHEEEIGNSDSCMDVLKNYCENHDGKFFSLMEFRYEVKQ